MAIYYERILQIAKDEGFKSLNDFALNGLLYESSSKLSRLKDADKRPSIEICEDIANKFELVNLHWFITGKGESRLNSGYKVPESIAQVNEPTVLTELVATQSKLIAAYEKEIELLKGINSGNAKTG